MLMSLFFIACGQPGPLYLPPDETTAVQSQTDSKTKTKKDVQPPTEQDEPKSEPQTDLYYPY